MKKRIICQITSVLLATILISATGFTQNDPVSDEPAKKTAIGIRIGGMSSDLWFPGETDDPLYLVEPLKSPVFGVSLARDHLSHYLICFDIMYERKGRGLFPVEKPLGPKAGIPSPFEPIGLKYLSVSAYFLYKTQGNTKFFAGPGIYNSALLNAYAVYSDPDGIEKFSSSFGLHGYDIGLGLKTGIKQPITTYLTVLLDITATTGFIPVFNKDYRALYSNAIYQNTIALNKTLAGTLSLSYRF